MQDAQPISASRAASSRASSWLAPIERPASYTDATVIQLDAFSRSKTLSTTQISYNRLAVSSIDPRFSAGFGNQQDEQDATFITLSLTRAHAHAHTPACEVDLSKIAVLLVLLAANGASQEQKA